ncbi:Tim44/TimA family putative adaptor protein [Brucella melitensis]|uniref:Tim44/TimA family putative adaptor protein n=1 Tax=Brucella melitensis TaxID=29459 RepID=UPI0001B59541|nr:Tim44/TimA family putative adaptor protein [Brucella melitensis]AIJ85746.1 tim44-like domain protein [Brucella melitensis bv. 3 str. Ether]AOG50592.1 calcium-binding protein [Brucella melitensis]ARY25451.1 calcium-binding protein [Brucella melitensis]ARY28650.1 calcium-binding protein [Brucella melitensis]ARY38100.1 calcium-binding protein [Brucella melitensis]
MEFFDFGTIFFFIAAVIIFLQLRNVLGRRTGNEKPPFDPYASARSSDAAPAGGGPDNVVSLPRRANEKDYTAIDKIAPAGSPVNEGLRAIYAVDPTFEPARFVDGVKIAYEMIVMSFADGDREVLKNLLSKDVYEGFVAAIDEREKQGETVRSSFVGIDKAGIAGAEMKGSEAHVTVNIVSQMISSTLDRDGKVIDGDPDNVVEIKDLWTFARDTNSRDPNWKLVATEAED